MLVLAVVVAVAVPTLTLPRLPHVSPRPALLGLLPWIIGKYVLCPLRWRALTGAGLSRRVAHARVRRVRAGRPADAWPRGRRRLALPPPDRDGPREGQTLLTSVALDRLVGAIGLAAFVAFAGTALSLHHAAHQRRRREPRHSSRSCGPPLSLGLVAQSSGAGPQAPGSWLAAVDRVTSCSIAGLLLGTVASTGYVISPLALLGAFGASQLAGAVPGPNGVSARDGALIVALAALGVPWMAATAAVTLRPLWHGCLL